jgi:RimJ/RimL family protein N-acetyltransferase
VNGELFLETERLVLRRFTDSDADAELLVELDSDPEVTRYLTPVGIPFDTQSAAAYRERIRTVWLPQDTKPGRGVGAAFEKATGQFVGWVFLRPATLYKFATEAGWTRSSDLELGYRLRREAWGRGLATEASAALVKLALADAEVTCVVAAALVTNRASWRVMEKVGMVHVRDFAIPGFADPLVMYAICREGCSPPEPAHSKN